MKISAVVIIGFSLSSCFSVVAEKESFVVKRKRAPSVSTLKEQCAQELGEIIKLMPELQERLAKEQKQLARLEKDAIHDLYDLLEDGDKINKQELQAMLDRALATRRVLVTDYESASQRRVTMLKNNGSPAKATT